VARAEKSIAWKIAHNEDENVGSMGDRVEQIWGHLVARAVPPAKRWLGGLKTARWRPASDLLKHLGEAVMRGLCWECGQDGEAVPAPGAVDGFLERLVHGLERDGACETRPGVGWRQIRPVVGAARPERGWEWGLARRDEAELLARFAAGRRPAWAGGEIASALADPGTVVCVARAGGRPLGYVACRIRMRRPRAGGAFLIRVAILHLAVDERHRSKGVGRCLVDGLIDTAVATAERSGYSAVHARLKAVVPEAWLDAQLYLRALGFRVPAKGGVRRSPFNAYVGDGYAFALEYRWGPGGHGPVGAAGGGRAAP
jgi:ribosomal protein S18 acetylase RimI-like enzyme